LPLQPLFDFQRSEALLAPSGQVPFTLLKLTFIFLKIHYAHLYSDVQQKFFLVFSAGRFSSLALFLMQGECIIAKRYERIAEKAYSH
jgi:hypothetical protein